MGLSLLLAAMLSPVPPADTPRTFVDRLYANYRDPDYNPLAKPGRVFARTLMAAIREDSRLSRDEVGYLDGDPVCQCQDSGGLVHVVESIDQAASGRATARIRLTLNGSDRRSLSLRLVRTRSGWRIADIATAQEPSLLEALRRSNRRRASPS